LASGFFHDSTPYGPLIHAPKFIFDFYFEFAEILKFESGSAGVSNLAEQKTIFKIGGSLSMDTISLG
jgi:hypothetical protein